MQPFISNNLIVKIADKDWEIEQAQKLRYDYLLLEYNKNRNDVTTDSHPVDFLCDLLIVVDQDVQKVVGTYRLLSDKHIVKHNISFFSSDEFDLSNFEGKKNLLEIGRAVVHPEYRKTETFKLLWTGLMTYCKINEVRYIFGTASFHGIDYKVNAQAFKYHFLNNCLDSDFDCKAKEPKFGLTDLQDVVVDACEAKRQTPSLINSYIKIGARVATEAFIDVPFNCCDLLVMFDFDKLNKPLLKRMFGIE